MPAKGYGSESSVAGSCGVRVIFDHAKPRYYRDWYTNRLSPTPINFPADHERFRGGANWLCSGFVQSTACRRVYETLTAKYGAPVFQTPVRINKNSNRQFFFAVWDTKIEGEE